MVNSHIIQLTQAQDEHHSWGRLKGDRVNGIRKGGEEMAQGDGRRDPSIEARARDGQPKGASTHCGVANLTCSGGRRSITEASEWGLEAAQGNSAEICIGRGKKKGPAARRRINPLRTTKRVCRALKGQAAQRMQRQTLKRGDARAEKTKKTKDAAG